MPFERMVTLKGFNDYEKMAMLDLSDDERSRLKQRFDEITEGFAVLDGVDTSGAEPLVTVLDLQNVIREDVAAKVLSREELLINAPEQYDGYISVPAAID